MKLTLLALVVATVAADSPSLVLETANNEAIRITWDGSTLNIPQHTTELQNLTAEVSRLRSALDQSPIAHHLRGDHLCANGLISVHATSGLHTCDCNAGYKGGGAWEQGSHLYPACTPIQCGDETKPANHVFKSGKDATTACFTDCGLSSSGCFDCDGTSHWNNAGTCTAHTPFAERSCHATGEPYVAGTSTSDSSCGTECGTGTMIDTNSASGTHNTCIAHSQTLATCHASGQPFVAGSSTSDSSCDTECGTGTMIDTNSASGTHNTCIAHTHTLASCHAAGQPFIAGTSISDSSCGTQCAGAHIDSDGASSTHNTCVAHSESFASCNGQGKPFIAGSSTSDSSCGTECGTGTMIDATNLFVVDNTQRNYADSVAYCTSIGRTIASVHSQTENNMIKSLASQTVYLGAVETDANGVFMWTDGTPWDYTAPMNDGLSSSETHIAMHTDDTWHDWGMGDAQLGVVCRATGTTCVPHSETQASCHGAGKPFNAGSSTSDASCGTECSGQYIHTTNNVCTPFGETLASCHALGKPLVAGSSTSDASCGTECGTDLMIDTNSASSTSNTCIAHTTFATLGCHANGEPNVVGSSTQDKSCGDECGTNGQKDMLDTGTNTCVDHATWASLSCHSQGKPRVDGDSISNNACGTECAEGTMIDSTSGSSTFNTCVAHTTFATLDCHANGQPTQDGDSTNDNTCGTECGTGMVINTSANNCEPHTSFTTLDCHGSGQPMVDGDSANDNSCGTECGTGTMIDTDSASGTHNTCIAHTTTQASCHASDQPFIAGSSTSDASCGTACSGVTNAIDFAANVCICAYPAIVDTGSCIDAARGVLNQQKYSGYWDDSTTWFTTATADGGLAATTTIDIGDEGDHFSYRWDGVFTPATAGTYYFKTRSDDASAVYIDGTLVVDNLGAHAPQDKEGSVQLTAAAHTIVVYYGEASGGAEMKLYWKGGTQSSYTQTLGTEFGVAAQSKAWQQKYSGYWDDDATFFNTATKEGLVQAVNSVDIGDEGDHFSYRWITAFTPTQTGTYTFKTSSDDASALYVDDTMLVNNLGPHGVVDQENTVSMTAGTAYKIEILYGEASGGAEMKMYWKGGAQSSFTQTLDTQFSLDVACAGLAEQKYSGYWSDNTGWFSSASTDGSASLATSIIKGDEGDLFSYHWSGVFTPTQTGTYTFKTSSDDASAVFIGGTKVVDNLGEHGVVDQEASQSMAANTPYAVDVYYGEKHGGAEMNMYWKGGAQSSFTQALGTHFEPNVSKNTCLYDWA